MAEPSSKKLTHTFQENDNSEFGVIRTLTLDIYSNAYVCGCICRSVKNEYVYAQKYIHTHTYIHIHSVSNTSLPSSFALRHFAFTKDQHEYRVFPLLSTMALYEEQLQLISTGKS